MAFKFSDNSRGWARKDPLFFVAGPEGGLTAAKAERSLSEINETRIVVETGLEARVVQIIEPAINTLGFRLVRVKLSQMNGLTLQIMAERPDGTMSVNDCEAVSKAVSPLLDIDDPIDKAYHLEVSSPGIDRPLVRKSDFERWIGHVAKLETRSLINGRKRFKGRITGVEGMELKMRRDDAATGENPDFTLPLGEIGDAKLTLNDDLIREALRRDKALRHANGIIDND
jgi:ribosome maturation factor RimP